MNEERPVISLCDRTGNMVRPWVAAGVRAITVDLQPATWTHPLRTHIQADVRALKPMPASIVFAFPPCTDLAISGARWFKDKGLRSVIGALELVEACREICEGSEAPWMIENPVGTLATWWRKSDYQFHPVHYAGYAPVPENDQYTKKTCLWVGNGFVMPDRKPGEPTLGSMMHRLPPSEDRADLRSATPFGFAYAVFQANKRVVRSIRKELEAAE
jgi:hypothetical protein